MYRKKTEATENDTMRGIMRISCMDRVAKRSETTFEHRRQNITKQLP